MTPFYSLIILLSPSTYSHQWQSPDYHAREFASRRLLALNTAAVPVCLPLLRHRDPEVRDRAFRVLNAVTLAKEPPGGWPDYQDLPRALPPFLRPLADRWLYRSYNAWIGSGAREFTVVLFDKLTWCGFPVAWAQWWLDRASAPPIVPVPRTP